VLRILALHVEPGVRATSRSGHSVARSIQELAGFLGAREVEVIGRVPDGWRNAFERFREA
jgi:uncharacterized protein YcaQ